MEYWIIKRSKKVLGFSQIPVILHSIPVTYNGDITGCPIRKADVRGSVCVAVPQEEITISENTYGVNAGLNFSGFFIISTIEFFFSHQYDSMISQVFDVSFKSTLVWKGRK